MHPEQRRLTVLLFANVASPSEHDIAVVLQSPHHEGFGEVVSLRERPDQHRDQPSNRFVKVSHALYSRLVSEFKGKLWHNKGGSAVAVPLVLNLI